MRKENGYALSKSQEKKNKFPSDNYGSFFGPSQPVITQTVIQESKSLLENQHMAHRVSNSQHAMLQTAANIFRWRSYLCSRRRKVALQLPHSKNVGLRLVTKLKNEIKTKVQKIKDTRDYSFLLMDDVDPPAPTKEPAY